MKPRKVEIRMEVETDVKLEEIQNLGIYFSHGIFKVLQIQANVIKEGKKK